MFKSKFEEQVASLLGLKDKYETQKIIYTVPETNHKYIPDFTITPTLCIETKGRFTSEDRYKMYCVKESNPDVTFVMYFQNAKNPLRKGSKTNYAKWCDKNGFPWYCLRTKPLTKQELQKLINEANANASK